jgi:hypothetical protein
MCFNHQQCPKSSAGASQPSRVTPPRAVPVHSEECNWFLLMVYIRIKLHMDLQADKLIPRRSQGTLLPSSGEPKVSNPWNNVQRKDSI